RLPQLDLGGERGGEGKGQERIEDWAVAAGRMLAAVRVWVARLVMLRDNHMFRRPQRLDPAVLIGGDQVSEQGGVAETIVNYGGKEQANFHYATSAPAIWCIFMAAGWVASGGAGNRGRTAAGDWPNRARPPSLRL